MSDQRWRKRFVGNRALAPETLMMGYGYDPFLSERSLKPPGLSHVDLRLPHRRGRQGIFRAGLRPAPEAAERGAGPDLQPDQQSRSRNARGPAGDLGRGGGNLVVRLGHGRDFDQLWAYARPVRSSFIRGRSMAAPDFLLKRILPQFGVTTIEFPAESGTKAMEEAMKARAMGRSRRSFSRRRPIRPTASSTSAARGSRRRASRARMAGAQSSSSTTRCSDPFSRRRWRTAPIWS